MAKKVSVKPKLHKEAENNEQRAEEILEVMMSYARMDFSLKAEVNVNGNVFDAIASGVNMLGEELKVSSVSLKEKNQLLREIHHRVKNNMQVISSLLKLQTDAENDQRFKNLLEESQNRIKAIALIHEMLYSTTSFKHANFKEYVRMLVQSIVYSYSRRDIEIVFDIKIDDSVCFDIDTMIPLGLILNEVISNSMKYAFVEKNKGLISIVLSNKTLYSYMLEISDNGIGLPKDFTFEKSNTLGIQLIYMLAEQIGGKIELENKKGAIYTLNFLQSESDVVL